MKPWTRTLNLDDAHTLLALAEAGTPRDDWTRACHAALPHLSAARRTELVRILRDNFLAWDGADAVAPALFLDLYADAPASAQIDLLDLAWALSHPLSLLVAERIVAPALASDDPDIPLAAVHDLAAEHVDSDSAESIRKTRTVLLGALDRIGTLETRGTGKNRGLRASRGAPHPLAYGYLVLQELQERGADGMMASEAIESSLPARLTLCGDDHARMCVDWCIEAGLLSQQGDEIGRGPAL